jgi:ATP-binding cassette, subfamily A (ABC1), member 3
MLRVSRSAYWCCPSVSLALLKQNSRAVIFTASPTEGTGGLWNYTLRADGALGDVISVKSNSNDAEVYLLPLQRAVDYAIASINTTISHAALPSTVLEYSYTSLTQAEFQKEIRVDFQNTIINIVAVAFLVGMVGVVYHESGFIASERELGMSQLLEAMMPNRRRWEPQLARILSYHLAFDIIYLPGWLVMGAVLGAGLWATTNIGIVIIHHVLTGLALASWSIFGSAAFKRAQLSGITVSIITLVLGILAQVLVSGKSGSVAVAVLGLLFPPCNYVFFLIILARYEQQSLPTNLLHGAPNNWHLPGIVLWIFLIIAIFVFPILGILIERGVHGTTSKGRTVTRNATSEVVHAPESQQTIHSTVELRNFSKHYRPSWIKRRTAFFRKVPPATVIAINDLTLTAARGQILVL